jgi:chromosome segregation ATPase
LDYLDKLYQKYGEAATQTGEWASAMERLKQVFPEINKYIDEQTGKLTASNDELKEYVENSRLASIEESKKAAIQELQNQYYEASVKYGAAAGERDFAESQMQSITDSLINYIVENYKASADAKQMPEDVRKQFLDAGYWRNMLTSGQFDMRDIFMSARNAAKFNDQNTDVVDQFQSDYEMYAESLSSASAEVENLKGEMESLQGQLATAESVLASLASSASAAAANLDAVASSGGGGGGGGGGSNPLEDFYETAYLVEQGVLTPFEELNTLKKKPNGAVFGPMETHPQYTQLYTK